MSEPISETERLRRWRLLLGGGVDCPLHGVDAQKDAVLGKLYNRHVMHLMRQRRSGRTRRSKDNPRSGSMGLSAPDVHRWLGDIRKYFPESVALLMQQDAVEVVGLKNLLTQKEVIEEIRPDVHLISMLLTLKDAIPAETKESARILVRRVVEDLMRRLESHMRRAIRGAIYRATRTRRPRHHDIDWNRTIRANLRHYQKSYRTVIPETLIGFGRRRRETPQHVIVCVDQSGSMATSVVYASVFGAVMASIPALKVSMVLFDTAVVDMTPKLQDLVDVLFGATLGGGTNIQQALAYCQSLVERPQGTTLILISDLYEGNQPEGLLHRAELIIRSGVQLVALLALSDLGTPSFDRNMAAKLSALGAPAFSCTPDLFPELMAATLNRKDMRQWAASSGIHVIRPDDHQETTS